MSLFAKYQTIGITQLDCGTKGAWPTRSNVNLCNMGKINMKDPHILYLLWSKYTQGFKYKQICYVMSSACYLHQTVDDFTRLHGDSEVPSVLLLPLLWFISLHQICPSNITGCSVV